MDLGSKAQALDAHYHEVYANEAECYDSRRFASTIGSLANELECANIASAIGPPFNQKVLDVAAGTGRVPLSLAALGASVTCLDLALPMLAVARQKAQTGGLRDLSYVVGNGRLLPFPDSSFDAVICTRFFHLIPTQLYPLFTAEMARVVRPAGKVIVEVFNPLYGAGFGLLSEGIRRWGQRRPPENFLWPQHIANAFSGLTVIGVIGFWLPGLGRLAALSPDWPRGISSLIRVSPLRWLANPLLVVAQEAPNSGAESEHDN